MNLEIAPESGVPLKIIACQGLLKEDNGCSRPRHAPDEARGFLSCIALIGINHKRDVGIPAMNGFQPTDVLVNVAAHFHFEYAKTPVMPRAREFRRSLNGGDGNGHVRLPRTHVCSAPQRPERELRRARQGVKKSGFHPTPRGRMVGSEFRQFTSETLIGESRSAQQMVSEYLCLHQAGLAAFIADPWKRCDFTVADRPVAQRHSDEDVLRDVQSARCDHKGINEGNVRGTELNGGDGQGGRGIHVGH